jgi:eukaryotic-like serine/threonine-protein kinase
MSPDTSSDERDPVERLAEEFVARHRRGENPSPADYAERHPQWADRVLSLFPALLLMEHHKPGLGDAGDHPDGNRPAAAPLERLGDYRIIREVGRGGMAVVYEAEQESLGRHVALKVLLRHPPLDPSRAARFQREARAAARLHHTNIVPVYGVGEHDGILYYVMQFIPGQGLDEVLRELRRLRRQPLAAATPGEDGPRRGLDASGSASATDVARGLLTGRFAAIEPGVGDPLVADASGGLADGAQTGAEHASPRATRRAPDLVTAPEDDPSSSILRGGRREPTSLSGPSRHYWAGVARIGVQVAEALQYSHAQGVLHRDIKPSNLLLDLHGTVWVADFGLAKLADQADLTHSGDVVGTWRYLAPERFRGQSDPRSDVYSLGLTLYELLVLRPAFDGSTREELIRQVGFGAPTRPRKVNPEVPRDLETIVLKATERDLAARYPSAGELAEDLRRFLEGRPPRARRCGPGERLWRWSRRNPAVAALGASVALLVVVLAIGSTLAAVWLNAERNRALAHLWSAYLAQAHAGRSGHQGGRRFKSLEVLAEAAKIRVTSELRNEAIACLALADLRPVRPLATTAHEDDGFAVDPALERYALGDGDGGVRVRRVADGRELVRLPRAAGPNRRLEFSPDGRYLVAAHLARGDWAYVLWDIGRGGAPRKVLELGNNQMHFSADGRRVAVALSRTAIGVYDPPTGELRARLAVAPVSGLGGFHPDGRRLMVISWPDRALRLLDIERGEEVWSHAFEAEIFAVSWRADGRLLAASGRDHRIYVWDMAADRLQSILEGHQNDAVRLQFTPAGDLLISSSWDGTSRVWDPVRGTLLLTAPADVAAIGPDGRQLVARERGLDLAVWEFADGRECRALHHGMIGNRTPRPNTWGPRTLDFSPDGRLLASSDVDGVRLWDASTGSPVAHLPVAAAEAVRFSPDGSRLLAGSSSGRGLGLWPLRAVADGAGGGLRIGPPRYVSTPAGLSPVRGAWDGTGRYLAARDDLHDQVVVLDLARSAEVARLGPHPRATQFPISPDGRWVATSTWKGHDVNVWEVASGRLAWRLPCDSAFAAFSPDGRWLAVAPFPGRECRFWQVGSWRPGPVVQLSTGFFGAMAFARHGRLFAIDDGGRVRLVDPDSGREVATLDAGTGTSANWYCLAISPDGTRLAAGRDHIIHLWDLRRIREQLAALGLDWASPPYPAPGRPPVPGPVELVGPADHESQRESIGRSPARADPPGREPRTP